jgi:hypothetical protein
MFRGATSTEEKLRHCVFGLSARSAIYYEAGSHYLYDMVLIEKGKQLIRGQRLHYTCRSYKCGQSVYH